MSTFEPLLRAALDRRHALLQSLAAEQTTAYRVFHGITEGVPGITVDRYGALVLAQSFREPLTLEAAREIETALRTQLPHPFEFAYNHRGGNLQEFPLSEGAGAEQTCEEFGAKFWIRARHAGIDPWLFLDLRAGRRFLRDRIAGKSLLNLFSYTCSVGISAAHAGASDVWNVDFAATNLAVGKRNALLNAIPEDRIRFIQEDCLPVMRQLAGLPAGGRKHVKGSFKVFEPRPFDFVVLDPPAWSKGRFGAVDVAGDYASLFKPAVLATKPGGCIIATNHVASVEFDAWAESLQRCAAKAGRPLKSLKRLDPDADFPSFDGKPPLKIAICEA